MKEDRREKLNDIQDLRLSSAGGKRVGTPQRQNRSAQRSAPKRVAPAGAEKQRAGKAADTAAPERGEFPQLSDIRDEVKAALGRAKDSLRRLKPRLHRVHRRTKTVIGETKAKNFPESNRLIVQLFLMLAGLAPAAVSLTREKLSHLRRVHIHASGKRAARFRLRAPEKYHPLILGAAAVGICLAGFLLVHYAPATVVFYEGEPVAAIGTRVAAHRTVSLTEALTAETTGAPFAFEDGAIRYKTRIVPRDELCSRTELQRHLNDAVGLVSYGYSLVVNEEIIGSTIYQGALESLLEQIKVMYASPDTLTVDFLEDVRVAEGYVPTESIMNLGQIAETINSTKTGEITYTVVKGDVWSVIAERNGMSSDELAELNPGYNRDKLSIGDTLTISNAVPYLTVRVTERQNYTEDIQYDIEYHDDASLYKGDYKVTSKGSYGTADIVAEVVYINGVEQERTVLSNVTLKDPVTEQRARGTKERPTWLPSGSFRWPTSGRITSHFGYRNTGIRGASTNHKGIDIAVPSGTPIYAADGGTVTFSGYKGAMGYVIIIDHGNGFCTYYEHNASLLVSAGAHVYKGQQIAKAGRSGVASGVHCHFGITYRGSYVNPLKYLS